MAAEKQVTGKRMIFWTPARVAATVMVLTLVAMFGASSCNSTDERVTREPAPKVNAAPVNPAAPAPAPASAMATLPATVLDAELKAVNGAP
ncbi:MAG TPA: hypothetical protein VFV61_01745, partial [Pyrinomonadaceae bacterium]|nr:hypothetical protein [Pyrinomonadaceae bacterium]